MNSTPDKQAKKTRSKSSKIVLWVLVGINAALLLSLLVMVIIAMCGGTGTSYGGTLGIPFRFVGTAFIIALAVLVFVWLITEPSIKKQEVVEDNHDLDYRTQYVRKAAQPRPTQQQTSETKEENKNGENS